MIEVQARNQIRRARRLLNDVVKPSVYTDSRPLEVSVYQTPGVISYGEAIRQDYEPVSVGFRWGPLWSTAWFRLRGRVPESWAGCPFRLLFDTRTEACCWWEGSPFQGVELHRQDVKLPDEVVPGHALCVYIEAACNHMLGVGEDFGDSSRIGAFPDVDGGVLKLAHVARYQPERAAFAADLEVLIGLCEAACFDNSTPGGRGSVKDPARARRLLSRLSRVCALTDHDFAASEIDRDLSEARAVCAEAFEVRATPNDVVATGHAHIDLAWLWPIRETKRKAARTFSTVVRYMERHEDYRFVQSMPQLYEWVRQSYPKLFEQIQSRIASGQWEVGGAMWVEPDCNLPSGESLARQLLHGIRYCRDVLGTTPSYLFLPDVFGYSAALPQLIKLAGLDAFLTQKISWNDTNTFPHHSFIWHGQDGTPVLSHFLPANDYNATNQPSEVAAADARYAQSGEAPVWLQCFGHGDGGGGPTERHLERARRLKNAEGLPSVTLGRIDEFFEKLRMHSGRLPHWHGELYLELHRGTYTTQAELKRLNRRVEDELRYAEFLLACGGASDEARAGLESAWRCLLLNQFHDILPGSGINWVVREATAQLEGVLGQAQDLGGDALIEGAPPTHSLVNPTGHAQYGVVGLTEPAPGTSTQEIKDLDGRTGTLAVLDKPISPYGSVAASLDRYRPPIEPARCDGLTLDNGVLRAELDECGRLVSLVYAGSEFIDRHRPANGFVLFADLPRYWDAWDIDDSYRERSWPQDLPARRLEKASGPLRAELEFSRPLGRASELIQRVCLDAESRTLVFDTLVDWRETNTLLRVEHPTNLFAESARYETQFGYLTRPNHGNTSWDAARFEVCAQRWMDLSEPDRGLALLNDSKYGHSCFGGTMGLSLLRSPKAPDPDADMGRHRFTYALMPHGAFDAFEVCAQAERLNRPVRHISGKPPTPPFCVVDQLGVVIDSVKPAEEGEGLILRCYETRGARGWIELAWDTRIKHACVVNLIEEPLPDQVVDMQDGRSHMKFKPFEIKTIRLSGASS